MRAVIRVLSALGCCSLLLSAPSIRPPRQAPVFTAVASGVGHSCALRDDGAVFCWGANDEWQLGDGTRANSAVPVRVAIDAHFTAVAVGGDYSCALAADGQIYCWGAGGQRPWVIAGGRHYTAVVAGGGHACGLTADGAAWCWGANSHGQVGDGSYNTAARQPVAVNGRLSFTALDAGEQHTCGVAKDHKTYCWGSNVDGQLGTGEDRPDSRARENKPKPVVGGVAFAAISAGLSHTCALNPQGAAYCWGRNLRGQLGDSSTRYSGKPVAVVGGHVYRAVSAGDRFTCALTADSTAYCWGDGVDGQLGVEDVTAVSIPVGVGGGLRFAAISAGASHACGLTGAGEVYCWGYRGAGRLGDGTIAERHTPAPVSSPGDVRFTTLALGGEHTCALAEDSTAYCWGRGDVGELGDGRLETSPSPVHVAGTAKLVSLTAGEGHTCGLGVNGNGYCWGTDSLGQLGVSARDARDCTEQRPCAARPVEVRGDKEYTSISAGDSHTCAATRLGEISCWGDNSGAQLGEAAESLGWSDKPKTVYKIGLLHFLPHLTFATVSSGHGHSCAVTRDGETYCWGFGRTEPRQLAAQYAHQFSTVSAGGEETCGLVPPGRIFCWGAKGVHWQATPRAVLFTALSVGHWHSCGLTADGTAYCWGEVNPDGRIGTDDTLPHKNPVPVTAGLRFKSVAVGWYHTCGITIEGAVYCWGAGYHGQLGDRAIADSPAPVRVAVPQ